MSTTNIELPRTDLLDGLPSPLAIEQRLGELYREEKALKRLLPAARAAAEARKQRTESPPRECAAV
jgi:hypothetical protein